MTVCLPTKSLPLNSFSLLSLSYTCVPVWRCFLGILRSSFNHLSITGFSGSSFDSRFLRGFISSFQLSWSTYFSLCQSDALSFYRFLVMIILQIGLFL